MITPPAAGARPERLSRRAARAPPRGCARRRASMPAGASSGTLRAGSRQRVKPICAASRTRSPAWLALAHLAAQAHLAEQHGVRRQRAVAEGRGDGRGHAEVGGGLVHLEPAGDAHEHVVAQQLEAHALLEHGQEQVGAIRVDAERHAPRRAERGRRDERLHLDQHRPRALHRGEHRRAGRRGLPLGQEERRRVRRPAAGRRPSSRRRPAPRRRRSGS